VPIFGASRVAGTTQVMSGQVLIEYIGGGDQMTRAHVSGDLRQLRSSNNVLDQQVRTLLKVDEFPTSDFDLVQPIVLPSASSMTTPQPITLHGQLTLQGVSRPFDVPATIQMVGAGLRIQAGVDFKLSQFGVPNTVGGGLATVDDDARFEFLLNLAR
jgi:polyisoprenoid-binding protein YceI